LVIKPSNDCTDSTTRPSASCAARVLTHAPATY
jgi:hypothetical protein